MLVAMVYYCVVPGCIEAVIFCSWRCAHVISSDFFRASLSRTSEHGVKKKRKFREGNVVWRIPSIFFFFFLLKDATWKFGLRVATTSFPYKGGDMHGVCRRVWLSDWADFSSLTVRHLKLWPTGCHDKWRGLFRGLPPGVTLIYLLQNETTWGSITVVEMKH